MIFGRVTPLIQLVVHQPTTPMVKGRGGGSDPHCFLKRSLGIEHGYSRSFDGGGVRFFVAERKSKGGKIKLTGGGWENHVPKNEEWKVTFMFLSLAKRAHSYY